MYPQGGLSAVLPVVVQASLLASPLAGVPACFLAGLPARLLAGPLAGVQAVPVWRCLLGLPSGSFGLQSRGGQKVSRQEKFHRLLP